jgi:hypothetical protein
MRAAVESIHTIQEGNERLRQSVYHCTTNTGSIDSQHTRLRDVLNVVTDQDDLVLDVLRAGDSNTIKQVDCARNLLTQEVLDLDLTVVIRNDGVDGEMGIYEAHLVFITLILQDEQGKYHRSRAGAHESREKGPRTRTTASEHN